MHRISATYLISWLPCLFVASLCVTSAAEPRAMGEPASLTIRAAILTDSWPIKKLVASLSGDLAFAGGEFMGGADGLVLIKPDGIVKLAATGDPVPGREGLLLAAVGIKGSRTTGVTGYGEFALGVGGKLAFSADVVRCSSSSEVRECASSSALIEGLFLFSERVRKTIALQGDPAPGTAGGLFRSFDRIVVNDAGSILVRAQVTKSDATETWGVFLVSGDRIEKVIVVGDVTPFGEVTTTPLRGLFLHDDGTATFDLGLASSRTALFRYENGTLTQLADKVWEFAANRHGDVVFRTYSFTWNNDELILRTTDGRSTQILRDGATTPIGGQFALVGLSSLQTVTITLNPKINDAGDVLFSSHVQGATAKAGLFLFSNGRIKRIAADGDPLPGETSLSIRFGTTSYSTISQFSSSALGVGAFSAGVTGQSGDSALFAYVQDRLFKVFVRGDEVPGLDGERFDSYTASEFSVSDTGEVAFRSDLCCGRYKAGVFVASLPRAAVANGGMETVAEGGLPAGWPTAWSNSGTGEVLRFAGEGAAGFDGEGVLRLHVNRGGGSTFVLSEPITVFPESTYWLTSRMRFYLTNSSDRVAFTVLQFDNAGNEVGIDEVQGKEGESFWTWTPKGLLVRTTAATTTLRIRFGLSTSDEAYLDVDDVR